MSPNTSESLETSGKFSFLSRIKIDKYSKTSSWFVSGGPLPSIRKNTQMILMWFIKLYPSDLNGNGIYLSRYDLLTVNFHLHISISWSCIGGGLGRESEAAGRVGVEVNVIYIRYFKLLT